MRPQTYANHRALPCVHYLLAGAALLAWAGYQVWHAFNAPSCGSVLAALGTAAILPVWAAARANAQKMQDRIIRLEMQLRLARVLPDRDLSCLALKQIIALRFAADHELPGLVERVLKGELSSPDAIKQAITAWQADWLRV